MLAVHYHLGKAKVRHGKAHNGKPFIMRYPNKLTPGKTIDVPVMAIDILPTIAEITGARLPNLTIDGQKRLVPFSGEARRAHKKLISFTIE